VDLHGADVGVDHVARAVDPELGEQECEFPALGRQDLVARVEVLQLPLERTDGLLARRIDELLVGLIRLALVEGVLEAPVTDLLVELRRERRMLIEEVLKAGDLKNGGARISTARYRLCGEHVRRERAESHPDPSVQRY